MERELPTVNLEGTIFTVDVQQDALVEANDPHNRILFEEMTYTDTHYVLDYQPDWGRAASAYELAQQQYKKIKLPHMVELDPVGMAEKYGLRVEDLKGKTDYEIMVNQKLKEKIEVVRKQQKPRLHP